MEIITQPSIGEQRVRVKFNPSQLDQVSLIKQKTAEIINLIEELKVFGYYVPDDFSREGIDETAQKITLNEPEQLRLIALAQTEYENAAMWAVKAATM